MNMNNLVKYNKVFIESFGVTEKDLNVNLEYNGIAAWDSVGHMGMIAELEETFRIELDTDDIIDFSSYAKGIEILGKYGMKI